MVNSPCEAARNMLHVNVIGCVVIPGSSRPATLVPFEHKDDILLTPPLTQRTHLVQARGEPSSHKIGQCWDSAMSATTEPGVASRIRELITHERVISETRKSLKEIMNANRCTNDAKSSISISFPHHPHAFPSRYSSTVVSSELDTRMLSARRSRLDRTETWRSSGGRGGNSDFGQLRRRTQSRYGVPVHGNYGVRKSASVNRTLNSARKG